jgi:hypothetical protein
MYSGSVNTVRLLTFYDYENKRPFIFCGLLRIGWEGSKPFDNFSQGGLVSVINMKDGKLGKWKRKSNNGSLVEGSNHPDTGVNIYNEILPNWELLKNDILKFLEQNKYFDYLGWDILVTEQGYTIIEANHNPDLDLVQVHLPYLQDKKVKNYFKNTKIIEDE